MKRLLHLLIVISTITSYSQTNVVSTFASVGGAGDVNATGSNARFYFPDALTVASNGDVYVWDSQNYKIKKITPSGVVTTHTGTGVNGYTNGTLSTSTFSSVFSMTFDPSGNLYVSEGPFIRKISTTGTVSTFVGSFTSGNLDGTGGAARFYIVEGLCSDASGNIYATDRGNNNIRKITPAGVVTTIAGSGATGTLDGNGLNATFNFPMAIGVDASGTLYVSDYYGYKLRKIMPNGDVTTLAGNGTYGSTDGTGSGALIGSVNDLTIDASGNIYFVDACKVRKVTPAGVVTTCSGSAQPGSGDGTLLAATYNGPTALEIDNSGNIYVSDYSNHKIRQISLTNSTVISFASIGGFGNVNATGSAARFYYPQGAVSDAAGNIYVCDTYNNCIKKITPLGVVSTFVGSGVVGSTDGTGTAATLNNPRDIAIDASGNFYFTESHKIRKITPGGAVSTFVGNTVGFADGSGTSAKFYAPNGLCIDANGNIFVADEGNHAIRKITPAGAVTTIAGTGTQGFANATGAAAAFDNPTDVVVDQSGVLFVADRDNNQIRKIVGNVVTTFAGSTSVGYVEGNGTTARFRNPCYLIFDQNWNMYVSDKFNRVIREITPSGDVTTFSGEGPIGTEDGAGQIANFNFPTGLALSPNGDMFVTDNYSNTIRRIKDCPPYHIDITTSNLTCFANQSGSATIAISGGSNSFTYEWTPGTPNGDGTNTISSLAAGTYTLNATDLNQCLIRQSVTITQPNSLSTSKTFTNIACNGTSTGSINLTVNGGTTPYTFLWSDGATTEDRTGLPAGTYSVTVTDFNGCTASNSATLTQPATAISSVPNVTNVNCFGGNNGAVTLSTSGSFPPYSYSWSDGPTTQNRSSIVAGNYNVLITDSHGCTTSLNVPVTQPTQLTASAMVSNVACFGQGNGAIALTPSGGSPGYTYNWGGGITTQNRAGLAPGNYTVIVTDSHGCTTSLLNTVTQPNAVSNVVNTTNVTCFGGSNGIIQITSSGGTSSYSYLWNDGSTAQNRNNLTAGTYTLTTTDDNNCSLTNTITVNQPNLIQSFQTEIACNSFTWSTNNQTYTNSGQYSETFSALNGCDSIVTLNLTVNQSNSGIDTQIGCDSYTWIDGVTYYTSTNTPTWTVTNVSGCDSLITLNLTLNNSSNSIDEHNACDSFTWIDGVTYYSSTNTPTWTITNSVGCDSIITLNLTITNSATSIDVQTACGSYTWIDGVNYTTSTNTPTWTLAAANGCDSIISLNLTINTIPVATALDNGDATISASGSGTYQWINCSNNSEINGATSSTFAPTSNGTYAVVIDNGNCSDTSNCVVIDNVGLRDLQNLNLSIAPNPTADLVTVLFDGYEAALTIYDAQGKLIKQSSINSGGIVSLQEVETGVYFFELVTTEGIAVKRVVKN